MMNYTNAVEAGLKAIYAANPQLKRSIAQDKEILEKVALFTGRDGVVPTNDLYQLALYENASHPSEASSPAYNDAASVLRHKEEVAAASARESENRATFSLICDHWPLAGTEANFQVLVSWCGDLTVERFQVFLETNPEGINLDWTGTRNRLLAEIGNEMDDGNHTEASVTAFFQSRAALAHRQAKGESVALAPLSRIENEIYRMSFWTKAKLRARLAELRYARTVRGKTSDEIRGDLAAHRQSQQTSRFHPFPSLPAEITASAIRSASVHRIKFWNATYGQDQVRARLNNLA